MRDNNYAFLTKTTGRVKGNVLLSLVCLSVGALVSGSVVYYQMDSQQSKSHQQDQQYVYTLEQQQVELKAELEQLRSASQSVAQRESELAKSVESFQSESKALKTTNVGLKQQLKQLKANNAEQQQQLEELNAQLSSLRTKSDEQHQVLEQSKMFFLSQFRLQQDIAQLNKERSNLILTLNKLVKECQVFLDGTSWDAKSDACDRKEKASKRLNAIDKTIDAKQQEVVQIDVMSEKLGLQKR